MFFQQGRFAALLTLLVLGLDYLNKQVLLLRQRRKRGQVMSDFNRQAALATVPQVQTDQFADQVRLHAYFGPQEILQPRHVPVPVCGFKVVDNLGRHRRALFIHGNVSPSAHVRK